MVSRTDWGRFTYDTGVPFDRMTGQPYELGHAREWTAILRTTWVLKGNSPAVIQVAPDVALVPGEDVITWSSCWDGIETPQPGKTYAVYMDRINGVLRTTRLVDINFALANDPLFSSEPAVAISN